MEIRKQMLGIIIGVLISLSFISPVYSDYNSNRNVCDMTEGELKRMMRNVVFMWSD